MLQITAPIKETFADGTNLFDFAGNWSIQYNDTLQRKVFASKKISDSEISSAEMSFISETDFNLRLKYKVSSEANYDKFLLKINNEIRITDSGDKDWADYFLSCTAGTYTIQFVYSKDGSSSSFEDKAYISELEIFPVDYTAEIDIDIKRRAACLNSVSFAADTKRTLDNEHFTDSVVVDTRRIKEDKAYSAESKIDTVRMFENGAYTADLKADSKRRIAPLIDDEVDFMAKRIVLLNITSDFTAMRTKNADLYLTEIKAEALRKLAQPFYPPLKELKFEV